MLENRSIGVARAALWIRHADNVDYETIGIIPIFRMMTWTLEGQHVELKTCSGRLSQFPLHAYTRIWFEKTFKFGDTFLWIGIFSRLFLQHHFFTKFSDFPLFAGFLYCVVENSLITFVQIIYFQSRRRRKMSLSYIFCRQSCPAILFQ